MTGTSQYTGLPRIASVEGSCRASVHDRGTGQQHGLIETFRGTDLNGVITLGYVQFCNFLWSSFQKNSMVWDISNHSGEESGRSGNLKFHQIQHRQCQGQNRFKKQFMLSTEIPGLLQLSGVLGCGEEGLMGLSVQYLEATVSGIN